MRRALHAEWIRVGGRRLALWLALAALASMIGGALIAFIINGVAEAGGTPNAVEQQTFVLSRGTVTILLVSIVTALAVGNHFRFSTILAVALAVPRRPFMMLAIAVPQLCIAALIAFVSAIAALLGATLLRGPELLSLTIVGELSVHMLGAVIAAAWACAIVFVTRSFAVSLVIVVAWPSLIEPLIAGGISTLAPEAGALALIAQPYTALRTIGESFAVERTLMAATTTEQFLSAVGVVGIWTTALAGAALLRTMRSSAVVSR
ncbi:hypothetical protein [Humidisolicoccus flavus]|uniref:hypothetical protein n=1 Tax=Humidisolicoccus flavus TaxID=3111414 RepID=UPI003254A08C